MYVFRRTGFNVIKFIASVTLFFHFIGHLWHCMQDFLWGRSVISWERIIKTIYRSGAKLAIPLLFISALMGMSIATNLHHILNKYHLQHKALLIVQNLLTRDFVPLLIGYVLCVQSSLNLITARVTKLHRVPQEVLLDYILPIIIGINITALLLYTYTVAAFIFSVYLTFHFVLGISTHEYLLHLAGSITFVEIFISILKTSVYCTIVSLIVGYYYYDVAVRNISVRQAVSRIITRGLLWLTAFSLYLNISNF
ncbi:ABC transporter permease [Legionella donaldsonii]|uniref:ABC transporter permease n=2 Tax=Legionella TaxID=445 RepID=A0A378JGG1_9GAMM|nr:ABC transporter permease [Legionella donaldsonii]STX43760.1 ABC transporter permease [Legionella donaldsonii]